MRSLSRFTIQYMPPTSDIIVAIVGCGLFAAFALLANYLDDPRRLINFLVRLVWRFFDFTGMRFVWEKINPPAKGVLDSPRYKPPATFFLWFVGIYSACYGIAAQRFENTTDRIENRTSALLVLLSSEETRTRAFGLVGVVQRMTRPIEPVFTNPISTVGSLFSGRSELFEENVLFLKNTVVDFKKHLPNANLWGADLSGADLSGADLSKAILWDANLSGAKLSRANLKETNLWGADLSGADLSRADLSGAILWDTNLSGAILLLVNLSKADLARSDLPGADLRGADLSGAILWDANLSGAILWDANLSRAILQGADLSEVVSLTYLQLCEAISLYNARLSGELLDKTRKSCPKILEKRFSLQ